MAYDKLINNILFIYLHIQKKKSNQITQLKQIPEAEIIPHEPGRHLSWTLNTWLTEKIGLIEIKKRRKTEHQIQYLDPYPSLETLKLAARPLTSQKSPRYRGFSIPSTIQGIRRSENSPCQQTLNT